ncbi:MAG: hypothetical protein AB1420_12720 [Bacillota bacterium]
MDNPNALKGRVGLKLVTIIALAVFTLFSAGCGVPREAASHMVNGFLGISSWPIQCLNQG